MLEWPAEIWPLTPGDKRRSSQRRDAAVEAIALETWDDQLKELKSFADLLTAGRSSEDEFAGADEGTESVVRQPAESDPQAAWLLLAERQVQVRDWFVRKTKNITTKTKRKTHTLCVGEITYGIP